MRVMGKIGEGGLEIQDSPKGREKRLDLAIADSAVREGGRGVQAK
jgi:hypothetical protein